MSLHRSIRELTIRTTAAALAAGGVAYDASAQCQYDIEAIIEGPSCGIFGNALVYGQAINDRGEAVGFWRHCLSIDNEAFYWSQETGMVTLERPPGVSSATATDISETGLIVGNYQTAECACGFIYDMRTGEWTELPPNEGGAFVWANAISPDGSTVVGARTGALGGSPSSPYQAFIYDVASKTFTDLGVMNGPSSWAVDANDGFVVGWTGQPAADGQEGFRWRDGKLELLGLPFDATRAGIGGVNRWGTVAGSVKIMPKGGQPIVTRPVIWPLEHAPVLFGPLRGYTDDGPFTIADTGIMVGLARDDLSNERAIAIYGSEIVDLNDRLTKPLVDGLLERGLDINEHGQILAAGEHDDLSHVAFVLSPTFYSNADLNGDCSVNADDLLIVLDGWGAGARPGDVNGDGIVNAYDLAQVLGAWTGP